MKPLWRVRVLRIKAFAFFDLSRSRGPASRSLSGIAPSIEDVRQIPKAFGWVTIVRVIAFTRRHVSQGAKPVRGR